MSFCKQGSREEAGKLDGASLQRCPSSCRGRGAERTLPLHTERTQSLAWPVSSRKARHRLSSWSHSLTAPPSFDLRKEPPRPEDALNCWHVQILFFINKDYKQNAKRHSSLYITLTFYGNFKTHWVSSIQFKQILWKLMFPISA